MRTTRFFSYLHLPRTGFEPARVAPLPPQSSASANFATWAWLLLESICAAGRVSSLSASTPKLFQFSTTGSISGVSAFQRIRRFFSSRSYCRLASLTRIRHGVGASRTDGPPAEIRDILQLPKAGTQSFVRPQKAFPNIFRQANRLRSASALEYSSQRSRTA